MPIELTGQDLTLDEIERVAVGGESVALSEKAQERVQASRQVVEDILRRDEVVYGINTGFGNFRNVVIPRADLERLQLNLIQSHSAGVGDPFSEDVVRAILLLRINALASGYSGIDPGTLDAVVAMLNAGVHPVVPQKGSVGASGDLAPLAHVALVLIGEGEAFYRGERLSGSAALERAGLRPVRLHPKDGLALIKASRAPVRNDCEIRSLHGAYVCVDGGVIVDFGKGSSPSGGSDTIDAGGGLVIPGLIDSHTHLVFAGTREDEFALRCGGKSYLEIAKAGGGIQRTVAAVRAASLDELVELALPRLGRMLSYGVTTVEVKSGYGLNVDDEIKMLEAVRKLAELQPIELVGTYLAAHTLPAEYRDQRDAYIDLVVSDELMGRVAADGLAEFCDVFCEDSAFTVDESRRVLEKGKEYGLAPRFTPIRSRRWERLVWPRSSVLGPPSISSTSTTRGSPRSNRHRSSRGSFPAARSISVCLKHQPASSSSTPSPSLSRRTTTRARPSSNRSRSCSRLRARKPRWRHRKHSSAPP